MEAGNGTDGTRRHRLAQQPRKPGAGSFGTVGGLLQSPMNLIIKHNKRQNEKNQNNRDPLGATRKMEIKRKNRKRKGKKTKAANKKSHQRDVEKPEPRRNQCGAKEQQWELSTGSSLAQGTAHGTSHCPTAAPHEGMDVGHIKASWEGKGCSAGTPLPSWPSATAATPLHPTLLPHCTELRAAADGVATEPHTLESLLRNHVASQEPRISSRGTSTQRTH